MTRVVYQLINKSRQETYVGMTGNSASEILTSFATNPPPSIRAWDFAVDEIFLEVLESFKNEEDGVLFFSKYWQSIKSSSWKVVQCEKDCDPKPKHDPAAKIVPCDMDCANHRGDGQNPFTKPSS